MPKVIPLGYKPNGTTNDGNTLLVVRETSTNRIRHDGTFVRKGGIYNSAQKFYSVPTVTTTFKRDVPDTDGNPVGQKAQASVDFRTPVSAQEADIDALIADVRAYVNSGDLKEYILSQIFPVCCDGEE